VEKTRFEQSQDAEVRGAPRSEGAGKSEAEGRQKASGLFKKLTEKEDIRRAGD